MSTTAMWLLLTVVAILVLFVSVLYKKKFSVQEVTIIGVMAALSFVAYEFFRIPNVLGTGSSFHLGNTFTALTALLLDGVSGGLAGAIGLALADIFAGDPGYAITTFVLKFIIGVICGLVAHKAFKLRDQKPSGQGRYLISVIVSAASGLLANVITDPFLGYFRNIYIFGQTSDQVIHRYAAGDYNPADWYEGDPNLRRAIDFLTGPEMLAAGKEENLARLQHELKTKDWFQTLPDFNAYVVRKGQALSDYACDPLGWRRKCLINISKAGFFSSDRTIAEYNSDIWHLGE